MELLPFNNSPRAPNGHSNQPSVHSSKKDSSAPSSAAVLPPHMQEALHRSSESFLVRSAFSLFPSSFVLIERSIVRWTRWESSGPVRSAIGRTRSLPSMEICARSPPRWCPTSPLWSTCCPPPRLSLPLLFLWWTWRFPLSICST